jgi:hypothetical protein
LPRRDATSTLPMTTRTRPNTARPLLRHWPFGCCSSPVAAGSDSAPAMAG